MTLREDNARMKLIEAKADLKRALTLINNADSIICSARDVLGPTFASTDYMIFEGAHDNCREAVSHVDDAAAQVEHLHG